MAASIYNIFVYCLLVLWFSSFVSWFILIYVVLDKIFKETMDYMLCLIISMFFFPLGYISYYVFFGLIK